MYKLKACAVYIYCRNERLDGMNTKREISDKIINNNAFCFILFISTHLTLDLSVVQGVTISGMTTG